MKRLICFLFLIQISKLCAQNKAIVVDTISSQDDNNSIIECNDSLLWLDTLITEPFSFSKKNLVFHVEQYYLSIINLQQGCILTPNYYKRDSSLLYLELNNLDDLILDVDKFSLEIQNNQTIKIILFSTEVYEYEFIFFNDNTLLDMTFYNKQDETFLFLGYDNKLKAYRSR